MVCPLIKTSSVPSYITIKELKVVIINLNILSKELIAIWYTILKRTKKENGFTCIYQNSDGSFLPDSSQPNPDKDFEITTNKYTPHTSTRYLNIAISPNSSTPKRKSMFKNLPELYSSRENCCGCTACYAICPVQAIVMRPDEEGFLYPVIDASKCIRCYKCLSVCMFKK